MKKIISIFAIFMMVFSLAGCDRTDSLEIPVSPDFVELVENGKISNVQIIRERNGSFITGTAQLDVTSEALTPIKVPVNDDLESVLTLLHRNEIAFKVMPPKSSMWRTCVRCLAVVDRIGVAGAYTFFTGSRCPPCESC
jgi:predicted small lipoprotein YifL